MRKTILIVLSIIGYILLAYIYVDAKVSGVCSNCHTMHNSQNGTEVATAGPAPSDATPHENLLLQTCLGCHSSDSSSTYYDLGGCNVPVVYYTAGEPSTYLAGGNFWWVAEAGGADDTKGHNVFYNEGDDNLSEAPGNTVGTCGTDACHQNFHLPYSGANMGFTPSGRYGCEGCHLNVKHHADDGTGTKYVDSEAKGWYRFLSGHDFTDLGVKGIEDEDWQATSSATDHNEYLGVHDIGGGYGFRQSGGAANGEGTMTAFCTGCHGRFHGEQQSSGGAWIRHPSDAVLPTSGEYSAYNTYSIEAPVSRPTSFDWGSGPSATVTPGEDMVMCLSCHRPHGSPYQDILRWDYSDMIAGDPSKSGGCFTCHTQKNQTP